MVKRLDNKHVLSDSSRAVESQAKRDALWNKIVVAFNEICGTNYDIGKLKRARLRIMQAKQWNSNNLDIDKEVLAKYIGEDSQADNSIAEDEDQKSPKYKHLSKTERITLVNLVKTFDEDCLLRTDGSMQRAPELQEKRDVTWNKITTAFNQISGTSCDIGKLKRMLARIKATPQWKAHSILYDLDD